MSRPARPTYTVQIFAPDADYPAGGDTWNGNSTKVTPPGATSVGFTPAQGNAAQYHNYVANGASVGNEAARAAIVAMHDWLGMTHVRNWHAPVVAITNPSAVLYGGKGFYFTAGSQDVFGAPATFCRTHDTGEWPTVDELVALSFSVSNMNTHFNVATDLSIVLPGSGADGDKVVECTTAGVWTVRAGVFANAMSNADCIFEPVSLKWIVAGNQIGAGLVDFYTSTNRTTWTARTAPASIPADGVNGPNVTLAKDGIGKVVAQFFPSSIPAQTAVNSVSFSVSSDGGVTWSALDTHTTTFASTGVGAFPSPIWTGTKWVAVAYDSDTAHLKTHVYNSTDGATWTEVAVLTATAIKSIACDGDFVVGIMTTGALIFSLDFGATWTRCNAMLGVNYDRIVAANGGFIAVDHADSKLRHSIRLSGGSGGSAIT